MSRSLIFTLKISCWQLPGVLLLSGRSGGALSSILVGRCPRSSVSVHSWLLQGGLQRDSVQSWLLGGDCRDHSVLGLSIALVLRLLITALILLIIRIYRRSLGEVVTSCGGHPDPVMSSVLLGRRDNMS